MNCLKLIGRVPMQKINENRVFGIILTLALLMFGLFIPLYKNKAFNFYFIILAIILLICSLFFAEILTKPRTWWMILGEKLGALNTRIIFTVIYLTIFLSIRLFFKLINRDRLKMNWKKYPSTYQDKKEISLFSDPF